MTMLQKQNDYNFTIRGLASETDDGVTAVSTALKLFESLGYIKRVRITEKGRFADLLYQISDEPILKKDEDFDESNTGNSDSEKPNSENLYAVEPAADNPYDLTNTNKSTTDKLTMDKLNAEETNTAHSPSSSKKSESKKPYAEAVTTTEAPYPHASSVDVSNLIQHNEAI